MKILAIVPTHDRLQFISDALESLDKQTVPADEIVVIGNVGPGIITDDPLLLRINNTVRDSSCDAFFILCDDDKLYPNFIEKTVMLMEQHNVDIVYSNMMFFGDCNGECWAQEWGKETIDNNTVPFVTALTRKTAWERAGGYAETSKGFFDWIFWHRCFYTKSTAYHVKEPLFYYRQHPAQDGKNIDWGIAREDTLEANALWKAEKGFK